jgi:hypothetical protein
MRTREAGKRNERTLRTKAKEWMARKARKVAPLAATVGFALSGGALAGCGEENGVTPDAAVECKETENDSGVKTCGPEGLCDWKVVMGVGDVGERKCLPKDKPDASVSDGATLDGGVTGDGVMVGDGALVGDSALAADAGHPCASSDNPVAKVSATEGVKSEGKKVTTDHKKGELPAVNGNSVDLNGTSCTVDAVSSGQVDLSCDSDGVVVSAGTSTGSSTCMVNNSETCTKKYGATLSYQGEMDQDNTTTTGRAVLEVTKNGSTKYTMVAENGPNETMTFGSSDKTVKVSPTPVIVDGRAYVEVTVVDVDVKENYKALVALEDGKPMTLGSSTVTVLLSSDNTNSDCTTVTLNFKKNGGNRKATDGETVDSKYDVYAVHKDGTEYMVVVDTSVSDGKNRVTVIPKGQSRTIDSDTWKFDGLGLQGNASDGGLVAPDAGSVDSTTSG